MAILKELTDVASVRMPIGETWTVSRCRYRSDDSAFQCEQESVSPMHPMYSMGYIHNDSVMIPADCL